MFGEYANFYAGQLRVHNFEMLRRALGDIGPSFTCIAGGYFHFETGGTLAWIQSSFVSGALVCILIWAGRRPIHRFKGLALLAAVFLGAAAPTLRFYHEATGFDGSRLFYLPAIFVSIGMALPIMGAFSKLRTLRRLSFAYVLATLFMFGVSGYHHLDSQLGAAELIARVRQDLTTIARNSDRDDVAYGLLDVPTDVDHAPTYGTFLGYAFRHPFTTDEIVARNVIDLKMALMSDELYTNQVSVQILRWKPDEGGGRDHGGLVPETRILLPPEGRRPRLVFPDDAQAMEIRPGLVPRDVRYLRLELAEAPAEDCAFAVVFLDEERATFRREIRIETKYETAAEIFVPVHDSEEWLFRRRLLGVGIEPISGLPPRVVAIDTEVDFPAIEIVSPAPDSEFSINGDPPVIAFRDANEFPWLRVRVFIRPLEMTWTFPRVQLEQDGDRFVVHLDRPSFGPDERPVDWSLFQPGGPGDLEAKGIAKEAISWRVEGLRGQVDREAAPQGASDIRRLWVVR